MYNYKYTKPRIVDEDFLMLFSKNYTALKEKGLIPVAIRDKLMKRFDCKDSSYYRYLKLSREKKYITDTYQENITKRMNRDKKLREMNENGTEIFDKLFENILDKNNNIIQKLNMEELMTEILRECKSLKEKGMLLLVGNIIRLILKEDYLIKFIEKL